MKIRIIKNKKEEEKITKIKNKIKNRVKSQQIN